jgi:hypothetical protein
MVRFGYAIVADGAVRAGFLTNSPTKAGSPCGIDCKRFGGSGVVTNRRLWFVGAPGGRIVETRNRNWRCRINAGIAHSRG